MYQLFCYLFYSVRNLNTFLYFAFHDFPGSHQEEVILGFGQNYPLNTHDLELFITTLSDHTVTVEVTTRHPSYSIAQVNYTCHINSRLKSFHPELTVATLRKHRASLFISFKDEHSFSLMFSLYMYLISRL